MSFHIKLSLLLILYALLVSLPILQAGFFHDDSVNSAVIGVINQLHSGIWKYSLEVGVDASLAQGRIFPLSYFTLLPPLYYFPNPFAYQWVRVAFIWLSYISVAWFIRLITKNSKAAWLFLLLAPAWWSIREASDALDSYGLQLSILSIWVALSLCCFVKFVEQKKWGWYGFSILLYGLALLTYEPGMVAFFCLVILAWLHKASKKQFLIRILPYVILSIVYVTAYILVQKHDPHLYGGVKVGSVGLSTVMTFLYELTAAFPLDYGIFYGHFFEAKVFLAFFKKPYLVACLILLAFSSYFALRSLLAGFALSKQDRLTLVALGMPLCIFPALLMAASAKYTHILTWGLAYLPIYVQYIGMSLFLLAWLSKLKISWHPVVCFVLSLIVCLSLIFNTYAVNAENNRFQNPRDLAIDAIQHGILNGLPQNAAIIAEDHWFQPAFFLQYGGRSFYTMPLNHRQTITPGLPTADHTLSGKQHTVNGWTSLTHPELLSPNVPPQPIYFLWSNSLPDSKDGTVILGRVRELDFKMIHNTLMLHHMTLVGTWYFTSLGPTKTLNYNNTPQNIQVKWSCGRHIDIPCFAFQSPGAARILVST